MPVLPRFCVSVQAKLDDLDHQMELLKGKRKELAVALNELRTPYNRALKATRRRRNNKRRRTS